MAAEAVFVDTNVLVYASRPSAAQHVAAQSALSRLEREGAVPWVSHQVLREYLAAVTRPQATAPALPMGTAIADIHRFQRLFQIAEERPEIFDRLLEILATHSSGGRQVHDANIVATMLDHGIRRLLTFNTADFQRFDDLIELEPLP